MKLFGFLCLERKKRSSNFRVLKNYDKNIKSVEKRVKNLLIKTSFVPDTYNEYHQSTTPLYESKGQ